MADNPTPTPAAAPTPAADPVQDGLVASVLKSFRAADTPKPAEAPKADAKSTETKPQDPPAAETKSQEPPKASEPPKAADPEPVKPKVKVRQRPAEAPVIDNEAITKAVADGVTSALARTPAAPAAPAAKEPVKDTFDYSPEEREELELAKYYESKEPSRKGLSDKLSEFFKKQKAFLEKKVAEQSDYDPSSDPEFKRFTDQNAPKFTAIERRGARESRIADEAEQRAVRKVTEATDQRTRQLEQEVKEVKERPVVNRTVGAFMDSVYQEMPKDIYDHFTQTKDIKQVREAFPMEMEVIDNVLSGTQQIATAFMEIRRGLKQFDAGNPHHSYVDDFIKREGDHFAKHGGEHRVQNGRTFLPPHEMGDVARRDPKAAEKYWTFSESQILDGLRAAAKNEVSQTIARKNAELERVSAARAKRVTAPKSAEPEASPKSVAASGLAPGAGKPEVVSSQTSLVAQVLGLGKKP